ncbi:MAG: 13E12 repeat family protein, partial [Actinomycetota bacterium]|nr:13E12 repeat family protein [Actinomycetota bacterium]
MVAPVSSFDDWLPSTEEAEFIRQCRSTLDYAEDGSPDGYLDPDTVRREHLAVLAGLGREEDPDPVAPVPDFAALAGLDPGSLEEDQALDYLAAAGKMMSWLQGRQYRAAARFTVFRPPVPSEAERAPWRTHPDISKWAPQEVAAALHTTRYSAEELIFSGQDLLRHLPNVLSAHEAGILDATRVRAILRALETLPREYWGAAETQILPFAPSLSAQGLLGRARRTAEKLNPESLTVRHENARRGRDVTFRAQADGMAELNALLPAVQARRFYETIQAWALHARAEGAASTATTPGGKPSRAMNEYRADALTDLLEAALTTDTTDGTGSDSAGTGGSTGPGAAPTGSGRRRRLRPAAQVAVTVGVQTLMALNEEPGHLDGYGPIPPDQARELAGTATSWLRILTHPEKGSILSIGRKRYKPNKDLRDWVIHRDQVCRGIGCNRPARDCDLDHTIPFHRRRHT